MLTACPRRSVARALRGSAGTPLARASIASVLVCLSACLEAPSARAGALGPRDVELSPGLALEAACTPSGVEVCFDASDNNCNGLIDEGCGVHSGVLQFVAAWDDPLADVELEVTDVNGDVAEVHSSTSAGLYKERACPEDPLCQWGPLENVYLVGTEPEPGRYRVVVRLQKLGGATPPIDVRLGVRIGLRSYGLAFELSPGSKTHERAFEFTL